MCRTGGTEITRSARNPLVYQPGDSGESDLCYNYDRNKCNLIKSGSRGSYPTLVESSTVACLCVSSFSSRGTRGGAQRMVLSEMADFKNRRNRS